MTHLPRRPMGALPALLLALAVLAAPSQAGADAKSEREEVKRKQAAVAAQIDTLRATDQEVEAALRALDANVQSRVAELADAERQAAAADAALAEATAEVRAKEAEIDRLDAAVKDVVVEAYMRGPSSNGLADALTSSNIGEAELKQSLLEAQSTNQLDVLDQLERAREDLETARTAAEDAATFAQNRRAAVSTQLGEVTEARSQQQAVVADVQERLDRRLSEAQSLAALDAELAAEIEAEQERIAAELVKQQAAEKAAAAARAAQAERTIRTPAPDPEPAPPARDTSIAITGSGSIVSVRGIRVHTTIAGPVARLLEAADAAGISLAGGGYRDPAGQIAVRRSNCGTSSYAVYQMPASSCSPPTARPGTSMHERGLAIDFTHNGRIINSRSSSAFRWLAANAAGYGLYNLPSEPWHWSVNGN